MLMTEKEKKAYITKNSTAKKVGEVIGTIIGYGLTAMVLLLIAAGIKFGVVYLLK